MHLVSVTYVAGFQAGIEGMIGNCSGCRIPEILYMTVYAGNSPLIVRGIGEIHAMFFVAVNAQLGNFICCRCSIARSGGPLQCCTVWVMACGAIYANLRMFTLFPVLHFEG